MLCLFLVTNKQWILVKCGGSMTLYKSSSFRQKNEDNYILYLKRFGVQQSSKAFNAQGDVSEPYFIMTELAIS
jgi:hypothetical protein